MGDLIWLGSILGVTARDLKDLVYFLVETCASIGFVVNFFKIKEKLSNK